MDPKRGIEIKLANKMDKSPTVQMPIQPDANTTCRNDDSLFHIFRNNPILFNRGRECIQGYINRNITFEIKKAIAISVMTSLMAIKKYSIMEVAGLAAQICGYSERV